MYFSYYTGLSITENYSQNLNYSRDDWDTICTDLKNLPTPTDDVGSSWAAWKSHFFTALSRHIPTKMCKVRKTGNTSEEEPFTHTYCLQTCWNSLLNINWPSPNSKVQNQKGYGQSTRYSRIWIQKCSRVKNCIRNGQLGSLCRPGHLHLRQCSCMCIVSTTWSHLHAKADMHLYGYE